MKGSKIGLGTVQFGMDYGISNSTGQTPVKEVFKILDFAKEKSVQTIDTAISYGQSEAILGDYGISEFRIVSKFIKPEHLEEQVNQSLLRLKVNSLFGLLAHRPVQVAQKTEIWEEMLNLKQLGLAENIGFSFNTPDEVEMILDQHIIPDIVQVPFNYFDHRFVPYINILKEKGCIIHSRSAFLQGLLLMDPTELDEYFTIVKGALSSLSDYKKDLPGMLLNYCLGNEQIDQVIIGINNLEQLSRNFESLTCTKELPDLDMVIPDYILQPSLWPKK